MTPVLRTIGSDPEVLLVDEGGMFRSAIGKIPGTKDEPFQVEQGMVHCDNVTAEINTNPAITSQGFDDVVSTVFEQLKKMVSEHNLLISDKDVASYIASELAHPQAVVAGCDPDWNAYSGALNVPPNFGGTDVRCAGGHIHLGCSVSPADIPKLVQVLDIVVALPMVRHEQVGRRDLYGKAGSFRVKEYGLEYRTPSNFWLFSSDRRQWIADQARDAFKHFKTALDCSPMMVQHAINHGDRDMADDIVSQLKLTPCPA